MDRTGRTLLLLAAAMLLAWVAFSSIYVVYPNMVLLEKCAELGIPAEHCNKDQPGFLEAQSRQTAFMSRYVLVTTLPPALLCAFYAHVSDCVGRRLICLVGALQGVAAYALIASQGLSSPWVLVVLCGLGCLSGGIYGNSGLLMAAAADITVEWSPTDRARVFSRLEGAIWLGQLLGPSIGGVGSNLLGPQHCMGLVSALYLAGAVPLLLLPETLPKANRVAFTWRRANPLGGLLAARRHPICLQLATGMVCAQWAIATGVTLWPLLCKREFGWPDGTIGGLESVFFAANAVGLFVCMPFLAGRIPAKAILLTAGISAVAMWSLFGVVRHGWQMFAVACIGTSNAMLYPIIRTSLVVHLGPRLYGAALGLMALVELFCQAGAPSAANATWHLLSDKGWPPRYNFAFPVIELLLALCIFALTPGHQLVSERRAGLAELEQQ